MVNELLPGLFRVEIPMPGNPLKAINSYVIRGRERNLIVDTGVNEDECFRVMQNALNRLEIDLNATDFFITHFHADHIGLLGRLATDTSTVYFNRPDADLISAGGLWDVTIGFHRRHGFPMQELLEFLERQPGYRYFQKGSLHFTTVTGGDILTAGNYQFTCVETPGHTAGHSCLFEPSEKILLAGDHILRDVSPNISQWFEDENPVRDYMASLDKISELDVGLVLPGHRDVIKDCKRRIRELKNHHQARFDNILSIIDKGGMDAHRIASCMNWDVAFESWEGFPVFQRWFAFGEALAHLTCLEEEGKVQKRIKDERIEFSLK